MEAMTIRKKRPRISSGDACCHRCNQTIPRGDEFVTVSGWDWCQDCMTRHEDWMAVFPVIVTVGLALFLFVCAVSG